MNSTYTSFYEIIDVNRFAQCIGKLLWDSLLRIPFNDSANRIIGGLSASEMRDKIDVRYYHGDVIYVENRNSVIYNNQMISDVEHIHPFFRPIFVKSKIPYGEQGEYRFVFLFQHEQNGQLAVQKEPYVIQIPPDQLVQLPITSA